VVITNPDSILQSVQQEHLAALTNEIALVRGVALVNGIPIVRGTALVNGVPLLRGTALVNCVEVKVEVLSGDTTVYVAGEPLGNGGTLVRGVALVNDRPFVSMTEIVRGVALVNGTELNFDGGYMSLEGDPLVNGIPVQRGVALVNGLNTRGLALVNGHTVEVDLDGTTTIDGVPVPVDGLALVNGIPVLRGSALVNSSLISRGAALVNGVQVVMENGSPTGRGIALVNGGSLRGIALVNGLPLVRGTALVNNLEVFVDDGEVVDVLENGGPLSNGYDLSRGLALVNDVALVNGGQLISRGTALVNGIALTDEGGDGNEVVNLANMNFMTSAAAIANGLNSLRGVALVNGLESEDGEALKVAAGTVQEDGSIVFENGFTSRGIAMVNGLNYVRGTALVNGSTLHVRGTALVNGSTVSESSNNGTILVFDATELGDTTENVGFTPISFITGTTVGKHWIVPGTFISNNYDISYGLGTLTIEPAPLTISAVDNSKVFGEEDPLLTFTTSGLLGEDTIAGALIRDPGEDVDDYGIRQGSVTAGEDYTISYDSAVFSILPASMTISISADDKVYDGTRTATVSLSDDRLEGSELDITYTSALFDTKHVGEAKEVTVSGLALSGADAGNYQANTEATSTADITADSIEVRAVTDSKTYDGTTASAGVPELDPLQDGDLVAAAPSQSFDTKHAGSGKVLTASGLLISDGNGGNNYAVSYVNDSTGNIDPLALTVTAVTDSKTYDGSIDSEGIPFYDLSSLVDDVSTEPVQVFDSEHAGSGKTLTASGLVINDGNEGNNYAISYVNVTDGTIAPLGVTVTALTDSKTYDGTPDSDLSPYYDVSGILDEVSAEPVQVFDNEHAGSGKTLLASGLVINDGNEGNNYAISYVDVTDGNIDPLGVTVTAVTDSKTYDGTPDSDVSPYYDASGILDEVSAEPVQAFDNEHAGPGKTLNASGLVINDGNGGNNYAISYVDVTDGTIEPLGVTVTAVTDSKAYDGTTSSILEPLVDPLIDGDVVSSAPVQTFDTKHAGSGKTLNASGLAINDGNGGNNYVVSYVDVHTGSIDQLGINVRAVSDSKDYDGSVLSSARPQVDALMSGDMVSVDPVQVYDNANAGTGKTLTASGLLIDDANGGNNYLVTYVEDHTGVITPRPVTVSPVDTFLYISEGDPLPVFAFIYNGWISGDLGNEGYTVLRDSDGAAYDQSSSESAGSYTVTPSPSNANYSFSYETGILHVNPYGPGTRSVKPVLNCIRELDTDYYVANFEYRNDNDVAVYIPLGEDNFLTGTGIDWVNSDPVPTMFAPGGGNFRVYFDGNSLTWTVSSREEDQNVSNAANANSNSTKCRGNIKSTADVAESADVNELDLEQLVAYPNPVVDKVYLSLKGIENYEAIRLFDFAGRSFPISSIDKQMDRLEIDMSDLPAGHYLISVVMEDQSRVVQLIKN
jgi:hypothetical protein